MTITWHGTASIELESEGQRIFFDPFVPLAGSSTEIASDAYDDAREIFITHGHVDHIGSLVKLAGNGMTIHCTATPMETLISKGISNNQLVLMKPGDVWTVNGVEIRSYQSRHISFDRKIVLSTLFNSRFFKMFGQAMAVGKENRVCKENGETVGYLVSAEGKTIFVMGSLALDDATQYPQDMDVLVLPYQGSSCLLEPAKEIVVRLRPRAVFLDHFDDTFPPISRNIDTSDVEGFLDAAGIPVIKPVADRMYLI